jgi:hypothetical protein
MEIVGKWATGQGGHMIYEFFDNGEFQMYTTADLSRTRNGEYIVIDNMLSLFMRDGNVGRNGYEVSENTLRIYPPDGGSPIVFERTY